MNLYFEYMEKNEYDEIYHKVYHSLNIKSWEEYYRTFPRSFIEMATRIWQECRCCENKVHYFKNKYADPGLMVDMEEFLIVKLKSEPIKV